MFKCCRQQQVRHQVRSSFVVTKVDHEVVRILFGQDLRLSCDYRRLVDKCATHSVLQCYNIATLSEDVLSWELTHWQSWNSKIVYSLFWFRIQVKLIYSFFSCYLVYCVFLFHYKTWKVIKLHWNGEDDEHVPRCCNIKCKIYFILYISI